MAEPTNDNTHDKVLLLQERIAAHDPLQAVIEAQALIGATMARGQSWKSTGRTTASNTQPQKSNDPILSTPIDLIGDKVQHAYGRLTVRDYSTSFRTLEDQRVGLESPEYAQKLELLQDFHWRWLPRSHMAEVGDDLNFRRIVCGWASTRWWLPHDPKVAKKYGGLVIDRDLSTRLVVDPRNTAQDLHAHEYLVEVYAMSVAEANRQFGKELKARGVWPLKSGTPLGTLTASDNYVDRGLQSKTPGAYLSTTPGVVVFRMFDSCYETLDIILLNPAYKEKDGKTRQATEHEAAWYHLWPAAGQSNDWLYGCPRIKLDYYKNLLRWTGDSLVVVLAPQQNVANLVYRLDLRTAFAQTLVKLLVLKGGIVKGQESRLRSNRQFEVIEVEQYKSPRASDAVHVVQMPRYDPATDRLMRLAMAATERSSASGGALAGEPSQREPAAGYIERVRQALVPYEPTATSDQTRFELWMKNAMDAAGRFHGETSPRKTCIFLFGENHRELFSGSGSVARARKVMASGDVKARMRDDAFQPQPLHEIKDELWLALRAGRFDMASEEGQREWAIRWFERTGQEWDKGESDRFNEASRMVGMVLRGEDPRVGYGDPYHWIMRLARHYLSLSRGRHYTDAQRAALRRLIGQAKDSMDIEAAEDAATEMRRAIASGRGPGGSAEAGSAAPGTAAAAGPGAGGSAQQGAVLAAMAG